MAPHVKSKRTTLKHKYKVQKKVRQHHREVRRSQKNKPEVRKISKKDPGIPNLWPYKQQMLEQIARKKAEDAEAKKALQQARREAYKAAREAGVDPAVAQIMADAKRREIEFESRQQMEKEIDGAGSSQPENGFDNSKRAFMKEFRKVMESSDVILEVLDARDPLGCRCYDAEKAIVASSGGSKRIVLVLNKVDMVPKEVADRWLSYLRNEFPTIPFRASVQESRGKGQADMSALAASSVNTSECLGASNLLSLLKNYSRSRHLKTSIAVGVIGYPNVGKSSLINSLKRTRAVCSGAAPGVTRNAQEVTLDKNIRLIDCPGIVFSNNNANALVLRNCIKVEQLHDPISPVEAIIKRVGAEPLMVAYGIPSFDNCTEFLAFLCSTRGKVRRGGSYDVEAAARVVLKDWNSGKIPFYTLPPKGSNKAHLSASVVQQWGEEFNVKSLDEMEKQGLNTLCMDSSMKLRAAQAESINARDSDDMETDETPEPNVQHQKEDTDNDPTYHVAKKGKTSVGKKSNENKMELE